MYNFAQRNQNLNKFFVGNNVNYNFILLQLNMQLVIKIIDRIIYRYIARPLLLRIKLKLHTT